MIGHITFPVCLAIHGGHVKQVRSDLKEVRSVEPFDPGRHFCGRGLWHKQEPSNDTMGVPVHKVRHSKPLRSRSLKQIHEQSSFLSGSRVGLAVQDRIVRGVRAVALVIHVETVSSKIEVSSNKPLSGRRQEVGKCQVFSDLCTYAPETLCQL